MNSRLAIAGAASYILFLFPLLGSQFLDLSVDNPADLFFFLFAPAILAAIIPSLLNIRKVGATIAPATGGLTAYLTNHILSVYQEIIPLSYSDVYYSIAYPLSVLAAILLSAASSFMLEKSLAAGEELKVEKGEEAEVEEEEVMAEEKRKEVELITCPHCGQQIPSDSIYCPLCGGKVKEE